VILGHEVSGVVTALGYGTTGVSVGDAVYGLTDFGVGSFALQLARAAGAHVIAAARGWARDLARELGAERFVDVDEGGLEDAVRDVGLLDDLDQGHYFEARS
jgi:NADPH:quinone reductase-like Zn-dependent oxidoreductase